MADDADIAGPRTELQTDSTVADIQRLAANIPEGTPGECDRCGEDSLRLVKGVCARCRDKFKLP